jgi:outer membrane protein assembly factor BamB
MTKNIAWKAPIQGLGWSSPVINGDQVWLTTAVELPLPPKPEKPAEPAPAADADKPAAKPEEVYAPISLRAVCYDRNSGKVLYDVEVFHIENPGRIHKKNSHASPTPVLEGDRLYLHYGKHGTACITTAGEIVWKTRELVYEHRHGPGGSPVVYKDLLLLSCDGTDVQYVVGLDKATGKIRWKTSREGRMAYTTPLLVDVDGKIQLISSGGDAVMGYEPETGKELWQCKYDGYSLVPRPVIGHGMVYICTGYDNPGLIAVRLGGTGDVTETHLAWEIKKTYAPRNASPILVGDQLYIASDNGILSCVDAKTGEIVWQERLGGNFSASPLLVDGRIYLLDEDGKTTVIKPGKQFEKLAENLIDARTLASFSVAGKAFFLRTDTSLYRIEQR